jgi:multidrug efflux pump
MGGMVGATVLGVLFVPVFYVVVRTLLGDRREDIKPNAHAEPEGPPPR